MGIVCTYDTILNRTVALKFLPIDLSENVQKKNRLLVDGSFYYIRYD